MSKCSYSAVAYVLAVYLGAALGAESADDATTIVVPIKSVWGLNMPGTKNVLKMERGACRGLVEEMRRSLHQSLDKGATAGPVIVVSGCGVEALGEAGKTLIGCTERRNRFRDSDEISVLFYSRVYGDAVCLDSIERRNQAVHIVYRLVGHEEAYVDAHFGLIPLGKLPPGKYEVVIEPSPSAQKFLARGSKSPAETMAKIFCESSTFEVTE